MEKKDHLSELMSVTMEHVRAMADANTIIGTPRMISTNTVAIMLQARFFSTLKMPNTKPRIQAKNRPHSASSRVCPIAASSSPP